MRAGDDSPMVVIPINQVQRIINQGLIKDQILPLLNVGLRNGKKAGKKGGAVGNQTRAIGLPCQCSATEPQLPPLIPALM